MVFSLVRIAFVFILCLGLVGVHGSGGAGAVSADDDTHFNVYGVLVSDGGSPVSELRLVNDDKINPVRFVLPRRGKILSDVVVPPNETVYVRVVLPMEDNNVRFNELWEYELWHGDKKRVGFITLAAGWGVQYNFPLRFTNCETITWAYSGLRGREGERFRGMGKDIVEAFSLIERETGLIFKKSSYEDADIGLSWVRKGEEDAYGFSEGVVATAGFGAEGKGSILFSAAAERLGDSYAGREPNIEVREGRNSKVYFFSAGRTWVIVHEIMHLLGFEHVERELAVMNKQDFKVGLINPVKPGRGGGLVVTDFSKGDRNGLEALYPQKACVGKLK